MFSIPNAKFLNPKIDVSKWFESGFQNVPILAQKHTLFGMHTTTYSINAAHIHTHTHVHARMRTHAHTHTWHDLPSAGSSVGPVAARGRCEGQGDQYLSSGGNMDGVALHMLCPLSCEPPERLGSRSRGGGRPSLSGNIQLYVNQMCAWEAKVFQVKLKVSARFVPRPPQRDQASVGRGFSS